MSDQDSMSEHSAHGVLRVRLLSRLRLRRHQAPPQDGHYHDNAQEQSGNRFHDLLHRNKDKDRGCRASASGIARDGQNAQSSLDQAGPFHSGFNSTTDKAHTKQGKNGTVNFGGHKTRDPPSEERVFGAPNAPGSTQAAPDGGRNQKTGQQVLLEFLHHINPRTVGLTKMLFNRHPISDNPSAYRYIVNQSTEQSDLAIILRDLTDGRLYRNGVRLVAAPWANLLFGDSFAAIGNRKQIHELLYRRSLCTCIVCLLKQHRTSEALEVEVANSVSSAAAATLQRLSPESAMANFTQLFPMPSAKELVAIGAECSTRELEIGTLIRLQSRAQAKLVFTEDVRLLFGNLAYTGPLSHEALYRSVTTLGVNYYAYNKGKKTRKVYVQGELVRLPIEMGVVKNGAQAMYLKEIGSTFVLYKPQVMSIYIGRIVFEGNSIGSFIETDIKFYVGFGQEAGAVAIYPANRPMGAPRRLGVNELLLHHHQVGDFEVVAR